MKLFRSQRGYTLLFAVLTATLVLGVTVSILSVSRKQFALSATARDSMTSFYAADAGLECAALVASSIDITQDEPVDISCNSQSVNVFKGADYSSDPTRVLAGFDPAFPFYISPANPSTRMYLALRNADGVVYGCVLFTIFQGTDDKTKGRRKIVESRGYNLCGADYPDTQSVRTVERALQLIRY